MTALAKRASAAAPRVRFHVLINSAIANNGQSADATLSNAAHSQIMAHENGVSFGSTTINNTFPYLFAGSLISNGVQLFSDARLKPDRVALPDGALASVMQLTVYRYRPLKATCVEELDDAVQEDDYQIGLVAQEVQALFPDAVKGGDIGEGAEPYDEETGEVKDTIESLYSIDYQQISGILIKSVQELTARVAHLETLCATLAASAPEPEPVA